MTDRKCRKNFIPMWFAVIFSAMPVLNLPQLVQAQVTFGGCKDIRGFPVASVRVRALRDVAKADRDETSRPVIWYNPRILGYLREPTRLWIYAHECAHHALGHNYRTALPLAVERVADCWGIRALSRKRLVNQLSLLIIQNDLARVGERGDWTHLPGPQRAVNLAECLLRRTGAGGSPSPAPRRRMGRHCSTQIGFCRMAGPLPVGTRCNCKTPSGPFWGLVR